MNTKVFVSALFLSMAVIGTALAADTGDSVRLSGNRADDTYAAGGDVYSDASINGDLLASGGQLNINGSVSQDVMLAGGNITLNARVGDDARIAGGQITINTNIGDDLLVAGGQITLSQGSQVHGQALMSGGMLVIGGDIDQGLKAAGGAVTISGHIRGDVDVQADQLTLTDTAVIDGHLSYSSPNQLSQSQGAVVHGGISYQPMQGHTYRDQHGMFGMLLLAITSLVVFFIFPRFSHAASGIIYKQFWASIGIGLAVLLVVPFVALLSLITVIGLWIGLSLIALYLVALVFASVMGVVCTGEFLAGLVKMDIHKTGWRIVSILIAMVLITALQWLPVVGFLTNLIILLVGLGATSLLLGRKYRAA